MSKENAYPIPSELPGHEQVLPEVATGQEVEPQGIVHFLEETHPWICEDCGLIRDKSLTVSINGQEIASFWDDEHLGDSVIDRLEVEAVVVGALTIADTDYQAFLIDREHLEQTIESLAQTEDVDYEQLDALYTEVDQAFATFLQRKGFDVTREEKEDDRLLFLDSENDFDDF